MTAGSSSGPSPQVPVDTTAGQADLKARGIQPWPEPDEVTKPFWEAAANGRLAVPRCQVCRRWQWPPAGRCSACDAAQLQWIELSGRGRVYSFIVDHRNLVPGFDGEYVVALVVPDEIGDDTVRLATNLPGCHPDQVRIGMEVTASFDHVVAGIVLPQFVPAGRVDPGSRWPA